VEKFQRKMPRIKAIAIPHKKVLTFFLRKFIIFHHQNYYIKNIACRSRELSWELVSRTGELFLLWSVKRELYLVKLSFDTPNNPPH